MEWWAILGVVIVAIISFVGFICAFEGLVEGDGWLALMCAAVFVVFGLLVWPFVEYGQAPPGPDDRPPSRGYVIGLEVIPAHTEQDCYYVSKVLVCDDDYVNDAYRIKVETPNGDVGWVDVLGRVFRACDIGAFYERGRCETTSR